MSNPLVSIGIPTYNRAQMLAQAIQSALRQTLPDFEIIVSDDCSTDDTRAVVERIRDPRVHYHRTSTNLRPPRNWNECARLARGEFFALLPDDDAYCPEFLAEMVAALSAHPNVGFAQCGFYSVDEQLRCLQPMLAHPAALTLAGEEALVWQIERLACAPVALLFRRAAMLQMGLWREDYWDDWAFIIRLAYRHGFAFIPKLLACSRTHPQNLNTQLRQRGRDSILDLYNQYADVFGTALPATPRLIALRAKLERALSQHCILLALGALRRREFAPARLHLTRARHLYALAGCDPGLIQLWLTLRAQARQARERQIAARQKEPLLRLETTV